MPDARPPSDLAPLAALPMASLDLETTGLDPARDRPIQVGLVAMRGPELLDAPRIRRLVDPGTPVPAAAARVTGITDADLAGAPGLAEVWPELLGALSGRAVVGAHIAFDLAVLAREAARLGLEWEEPPSLDIALLAGALEPSLAEPGLDAAAALFGVEIANRHDALGDALAAGECMARAIPRLAGRGVVTLSGARAFAARRGGAGGAPAGRAPSPPPPPRLDGAVFARALGEAMSAPPVFVPSGTSLSGAARVMVERRIGAVLVGDPAAPPLGVLTERDVLVRAAAVPPRLDAPVDEAMSRPVAAMAADEPLYRALGRMDRIGARHLAVADERGIARGMVSQRDLLAHRARAESLVADATGAARTGAELGAALARVPEAADGLLRDGLDGAAVARVVARELRAATGRAAELAARRLEAGGMGPAPAPYAVLVLGSGGRGESLLGADQDNAIVHAGDDGNDGGDGARDPWFAALGAAMADLLAEAGVPRCDGGVMAANPPWRGSEAAWRARIEQWLGRARPEDLLSVDIFFDLRVAHGPAGLGERLLADAVAGAARTRPFLGLMAQSAGAVAPRLGFLGRLPGEGGRIDLKRQCLLPLVGLARALALASGSAARATPDRLAAAAGAGRLPPADAAALAGLHREAATFVLRQQLADLREGARPSNRVRLSALAPDERARLRAGLKRLAALAADLPGLMAG